MTRARDERPGGDDGHGHQQDTGTPGARPDEVSEHRHAKASDARLTALLRADSPSAYQALRELRERHHPAVLAYARLCAASESSARELATQAFTVATRETARGIEPTVPWRHRLLLLTARVAARLGRGRGRDRSRPRPAPRAGHHGPRRPRPAPARGVRTPAAPPAGPHLVRRRGARTGRPYGRTPRPHPRRRDVQAGLRVPRPAPGLSQSAPRRLRRPPLPGLPCG